MKRKVFLIVSGIELILSIYYAFCGDRDPFAEFFYAGYIFGSAVILALLVSFVLMWFPSKSSWRTSVFLHCLTCPCIFFITCMAVPDFAKNAYESYHFNEEAIEYHFSINTFRKEFDGSVLIPQTDGRRHFVYVDGKYVKDGQKIRLLSKSVSYYYSPICKEEEMFFDSFKEDLYMDQDSIYGLNGKNYAWQQPKE